MDRSKVNDYVQELKGVGIDELTSESLDNLKEYLGGRNADSLNRFRGAIEVEVINAK